MNLKGARLSTLKHYTLSLTEVRVILPTTWNSATRMRLRDRKRGDDDEYDHSCSSEILRAVQDILA